MGTIDIRKFRHNLRHFERELDVQNNSGTCCGVTIPQCHTLMELYNVDDIQLNELSKKLYLDKSTVSRTVDSLVNLNLVTRETPKMNRRSIRVKLTEKGKTVCNTINKGNDEYFMVSISAIPQSIRNNFLDGFEILVKKMIELNHREQ